MSLAGAPTTGGGSSAPKAAAPAVKAPAVKLPASTGRVGMRGFASPAAPAPALTYVRPGDVRAFAPPAAPARTPVPRAAQHDGGGGLLAAISAPLSALVAPAAATAGVLSDGLHAVGDAGKAALNFGVHQAEGIGAIGSALYDDVSRDIGHPGNLLHFNLGGGLRPGAINVLPETSGIVRNAVNSDPIGQMLQGHIGEGINTAINHPVDAALDLTGVGGITGRVLGAAARTGHLGDTLARVADTTRADRELFPGLPGDKQYYSNNIFRAAAQKYLDANHPDLGARLRNLNPLNSDKHWILKRVDEQVPTDRIRENRAAVEQAKITKALKPEDHLMADVLPEYLRGRLGNAARPESVAEAAGRRILEMQRAVAEHEAADRTYNTITEAHRAGDHEGVAQALHDSGHLDLNDPEHPAAKLAARYTETGDPRAFEQLRNQVDAKRFSDPVAVLAANAEHQRLLQAVIDRIRENPDLAQLHEAAQAYGARQGDLESALNGLEDRGLLEAHQGERRAVAPYALTNIKGAVHVKDPMPTPAALNHAEMSDHIAALKQAGAAAKLALAKTHARAALADLRNERNAHAAAEPSIRGQARATQSATTKYGVKRLMDAKLPDSAYSRIERNSIKYANSRDAIDAAREQRRAGVHDRINERAELAASHKAELQDARDALKEAMDKGLAKKGETFTGLAVPDLEGRLRPLSNEEIHAHMAANGMDGVPISYSQMRAPSHETSKLGAFGARATSRGASTGPGFTGEGLDAGAYEPGFRALSDSQRGTVNRIQRAISHDNFIKNFALADKDGTRITADSAKQMEYELQKAGINRADVTVISSRPAKVSDGQAQRIVAHQEGDPLAAGEHLVAVPRIAAERYEDHMAPKGRVFHGAQKLTNTFRRGTLLLSPKWPTSVLTEGMIRAGMHGAGILDHRYAGQELEKLRALHPEAAQHVEDMAITGRHMGMHAQDLYDAMDHNPDVERGAARQVLHDVSQGWQGATQKYTGAIGRAEAQFEQAVLGQYMRDHNLTARDLADPAVVRDAARHVQDILGNYNHFSPNVRDGVTAAAPFMPWYYNAGKFMYHDMPSKYPLRTSLVDQVGQQEQQRWQNAHDPKADGSDRVFGIPMGGMQDYLKIGPGKYLNAGRFMPQGLIQNGPADALQTILPEVSPIAQNLAGGVDAFGNPLKIDGQKINLGQRLVETAGNLVGETGPGGLARLAVRAAVDQGRKPWNGNSTLLDELGGNVKYKAPNDKKDWLKGLAEILFPFYPVSYGATSSAAPAGASLGGGQGSLGGGGGSLGGGKGSLAGGKGSLR